jgi:hypothetical protein
MVEGCKDLDVIFSDTDRYPSLKEVELCSFVVTRIGNTGRDSHERFSMDEYLPRLKAIGRLPA